MFSQVRGREIARGQQGGDRGGARETAGQDHGAVPVYSWQGRVRGVLQEGQRRHIIVQPICNKIVGNNEKDSFYISHLCAKITVAITFTNGLQ